MTATTLRELAATALRTAQQWGTLGWVRLGQGATKEACEPCFVSEAAWLEEAMRLENLGFQVEE